MKWMRFTIDTHTDAVDMLSYQLGEIGVEGIEIEDHVPLSAEDKEKMFVDILPDPTDNDGSAKVHFYMEPEQCNPEKVMLLVQDLLQEISGFYPIGKGTISLSETEDKDWVNNWKAFFKPFRASDNILIKPTWEDCEKEQEQDIIIEIDPGIAFGTGSHETTMLCIQALNDYIREGNSVLDAGCGSGILSITALKLGAEHVTAVDIDETAVRVTRENMNVNHLDSSQYTLFDGNLIGDDKLRENIGTGYHIIVANILADVIIPLTDVIRPHMAEGGFYIVSGILDTKEEDVRNALTQNGFEIVEARHKKEWCCLIAR